MTSTAGFLIHPEAAEDIVEICEFIEQDNAPAAIRFRTGLLTALRKLAEFPNSGHKRPEFAGSRIRFSLFREYLIAYTSDQRPILVLAIIHGRRHPRIIAAVLRGRT